MNWCYNDEYSGGHTVELGPNNGWEEQSMVIGLQNMDSFENISEI